MVRMTPPHHDVCLCAEAAKDAQGKREGKVKAMSVARVTEISVVSTEGFEEAIREGINKATETLRNVEGAWVKDQNIMIKNGNITGYKVNLAISFVLKETQEEGDSSTEDVSTSPGVSPA